MGLYVWLLRIVVILNVLCLFLAICLLILACYPILRYVPLVHILYGEDITQEFKTYRITVIVLAAICAVLSGFGITLGTSPHKCFSILFLIASLVVMLCSFVGMVYELELMTDMGVEKYDFEEIFSAEALQYQVGLNRMHYIQKRFRCCGVTGPFETFGEKMSADFPYSCCGLDYPSTTCKKDLIYMDGCAHVVSTSFSRTSYSIIAICATIFIAHLIIFAIVFYIVRTYDFTAIDEPE